MVCIGHVPLEHAIYDRADTNLGLPEVRIIGASPRPRWLDVLLCTGERVRVVASSLNLLFRFHPMLLPFMANLVAGPVP
jgi:hypothetical protein